MSADSTINQSRPPRPRWAIVCLPIGALALTVIGFMVGCSVLLDEPHAWVLGCIPGILFGLLAMLITLIVISPKAPLICTFVGERGIASYERNRPNAVPVEKLMLFESCHEVFTSITESHLNHVYMVTGYKYFWKNERDEVINRLEGNYRKKSGGEPPAGDLWWYAVASEKQWNRVAAERLASQLKSRGYMRFSVKQKDALQVGPGFVDIITNGETTRLVPEDVRAIGLSQGRFIIRTHDARWYRNQGTHEYLCESIGNLYLCLNALRETGGFRDPADQ